MAKILTVRYTLVSGTIPNGLTLNPDTGVLSGSPGFDSLGQGPAWQSPSSGSLGAYDESDTITPVALSTTSSHTPVTFSLATSNDKLPWGLILNPTTGVISGTIAPLKQRVKEAGVTFDGPTWNTGFGKLAGFDEDSVSSISLSATPIGSRTISRFTVVDGYLPWGLKLNPTTGVITGTVGRLKNPGAYVDVPKLPVPTWTTDATLGTLLEYETANYTIAATPDTGRSMSKYVIREGFLPWGLKLNAATGVISGTVIDQKKPDSAYYDSTKDPVFSDTVVINGSNTTVVNNGSIGSYAKGTAVSVTFSATPVSGRAVRNYWIESGTIPTGLIFNPNTGVMSGTILNNARVESKIYSFTIKVTDKNASNFLVNSSSRTFTITVQ